MEYTIFLVVGKDIWGEIFFVVSEIWIWRRLISPHYVIRENATNFAWQDNLSLGQREKAHTCYFFCFCGKFLKRICIINNCVN